MLLPLERGSEALQKGKVLGELGFQFCNGDATLHMLLQEFVIAPF